MSHLKKSKAALDAAKDAQGDDKRFLNLLDIARVQAAVAQAEASERIADALERITP